MLLADMLNTIVREITTLATRDNENQHGAAISNVVVLCVLCLIFVIVNVVLFFVSLCSSANDRNNNLSCLSIIRRAIIVTVQTLGAMLYIYGDNIGYILQNYSEELGCGTQCVINNRIAAVLTLGLALVILHLFPIAFRKLDVVIHVCFDDWDDKTSPWNTGMDLITLFVKIDILYTTIAIMTQTSEFCSHTDMALSIAFVVLCLVAGIAFMVIDFFYACTIIYKHDEDNIGLGSCVMIPSCVLLALSLCMYLITDNEQPLDCGFGCDTFAANQTMNEISCNVTANSGVRLGFMLVATGIVATLAVIWIIIGLCTEQKVDVIDGTVKKDKNEQAYVI